MAKPPKHTARMEFDLPADMKSKLVQTASEHGVTLAEATRRLIARALDCHLDTIILDASPDYSALPAPSNWHYRFTGTPITMAPDASLFGGDLDYD